MVININGLNRLNDSINQDIRDFESYIYDLLSTVKNMSFYWHDGYTTSFFNRIDRSQADINDLVDSLYKLSNSMRVAVTYYNSINYSKGEIGAWGWVNTDDFYVRQDDDDEMKNRKRILWYRSWYAEDDISYNINGVSVPFVSSIDFNNLDVNNDMADFVGMQDNMADEINKFKSKIEAFGMYANKLVGDLYSLGSVYDSSNVGRFTSKADAVNDSINKLYSNFSNACLYVDGRRKAYNSTFENLASDIRNGGQ